MKINNCLTWCIVLVLAFASLHEAKAQHIAVKTNALYWATASPNISAEVGLAPHWTFEIGGGLNPFTFKENRKWKHYQWQGEVRYWFCERFYRHFIGLHAGGGEMNVGRVNCPWPKISEDNRYEGWAVKAGVSYGYSFVLGGRWNLETTIGLGVVHANYDRYGCAACGNLEGSFNKTMFAPTKAGITFIYMIR